MRGQVDALYDESRRARSDRRNQHRLDFPGTAILKLQGGLPLALLHGVTPSDVKNGGKKQSADKGTRSQGGASNADEVSTELFRKSPVSPTASQTR